MLSTRQQGRGHFEFGSKFTKMPQKPRNPLSAQMKLAVIRCYYHIKEMVADLSNSENNQW